MDFDNKKDAEEWLAVQEIALALKFCPNGHTNCKKKCIDYEPSDLTLVGVVWKATEPTCKRTV